VICDNCRQDRTQHHIKTVAFLRPEWPPIEFVRMCRRCRAELSSGFFHRGLFYLCFLVLLAVVAACGFGAVLLIQWLTQQGSSL